MAALQTGSEMCTINITCYFIPNMFSLSFINSTVNQLTSSQDSTPQVWAGTDHWLVSVLNATVMGRNATLYNQVAGGPTPPHIFYVYDLPDPVTAATVLVRVFTGAMLSAFKQILDNFRSYSTTGPRVNVTVIYDNTTDLNFMGEFLFLLDQTFDSDNTNFGTVRRIVLRTVNARTLTSANVASFFTSEVQNYGGFYLIMTSTALADIIVQQIGTSGLYTTISSTTVQLTYDSSFWLYFLFNYTGFRPSYSTALASQQLFVIEQVLWTSTQYPVVSVCPTLYTSSFEPNWQTSASNQSSLYTSQNYTSYNFLQECEFGKWLKQYQTDSTNGFCTLNLGHTSAQFVLPNLGTSSCGSFSCINTTTSQGTMFFNSSAAAASPSQRQNVRFSFGLGTGTYGLRLYQDSNTFGTDEIIANASAAFSPNISALRTKMASITSSGSVSANLTVVTIQAAPYWYVDPNNNTVGLVYDIYQQLSIFMATNYNISLSVKVVGDGLTTNGADLQGQLLSNGSWTGIMGLLLTQQADLAIGPLIANQEQEALVAFSSTFLRAPITLLRKVYDTPPWYTSLLYVYTVTFDWLLWVVLGCVTLFTAVFLTVIDLLVPNRISFFILRSLYFTMARAAQGVSGVAPDRWSSRCIVIVWFFECLFITISFTANLTATMLTEQIHTVSISGIYQLLYNQLGLNWPTVGGRAIATFYKYQTTLANLQLYNASNLTATTYWQAVNLAQADSSYVLYYDGLMNRYQSYNSCSAVLDSSTTIGYVDYAFALSPGVTKISIDTVNKFILTMLDTQVISSITSNSQEIIPQQFKAAATCRGQRGIIGYISWGLLYFNDLLFQGNSQLDDPNEQTFTLFNLAGPFALIVAGIVASVMIAILEFLILVNQRLFNWAKRTYHAQEERILRWRKTVEKKRKERERRRKFKRAQRKLAPVVISPNPYLMLLIGALEFILFFFVFGWLVVRFSRKCLRMRRKKDRKFQKKARFYVRTAMWLAWVGLVVGVIVWAGIIALIIWRSSAQ